MSRTNSTETFTLEQLGELQIVDKYKKLMAASTARGSLYIKAKETMLEYFESELCELSEREKSELLVKLVGDMAIQMTQAAMSTALKVAEVDLLSGYTAAKMKADTLQVQEQVDLIAAQNLKVGSDIDNTDAEAVVRVISGWKAQSDLFRDNGIDTKLWDTSITAIQGTHLDYGTKFTQTNQLEAGTYATYAKSYRDSGIVDYTLTEGSENEVYNGNGGKLVTVVNNVDTATAGLTVAQTKVAIRQEQGFDDNILQHTANSSASFMGLLLSGDESAKATTPIGDEVDGEGNLIGPTPLGLWADALVEMNKRATDCLYPASACV